uniref:Uncharacterized protein n=1 Tax=Panagrolaimus sp. PS1159 TaxID=55785 RepID=A0AC35G9P5_9BILA
MQESFAFAQFNKRSGSASLISNGILSPRFLKCNEINVESYNEWKNFTINKVYQSSPYQIIFRAFGSNKDNIVAIKNLYFSDGLLCKNRKIRNSDQNQINVITYEDWEKTRKENEKPPQVRPRILLVVSEHVESSTEIENSTFNVATLTTTPSSIITTTTTQTTTTTLKQSISRYKAATAAKTPPTLDAQNVPNLGQWVQLLKNVAPIIPIIPSLINSLKYNESPPQISSTATLNNQYSSNPDLTFRNEEKVFSWKPGETRRAPTPIVPLAINQVPTTTTTSTFAPPIAGVVVFEKPKQQLSDVRTSVSQNLKYLTPQMIDELNMVSNLPDLEVLTDGLDLSLLNKPGGFSILKQQFMERLIKRLPFKDDDTDLLRYRS